MEILVKQTKCDTKHMVNTRTEKMVVIYLSIQNIDISKIIIVAYIMYALLFIVYFVVI